MYPNFKIINLEYFKKYDSSILTNNEPELINIVKITADYGLIVIIGIAERDSIYKEVLYDAAIVINNDGTILGSHRKIIPFGAEKLIFKAGDARDIKVFETEIGKIGIGLCFENLNPLYRRALTLLGEEIHCALWVNINDIKHIVDSSSKVSALEGGTYVVISSQVTIEKDHPLASEQLFIGGSGILNPWEIYISGPIYGHEEVLYADIDLDSWNIKKYQSRGIESRDDLLSLNLTIEEYKPLHFKEIKKVEMVKNQTDK